MFKRLLVSGFIAAMLALTASPAFASASLFDKGSWIDTTTGTTGAGGSPSSQNLNMSGATGPGMASQNQGTPADHNPWDGNMPTLTEMQKLADAASKVAPGETYLVLSKWSKTLYLYRGKLQVASYPALIGMIEGWDKEYQGDMRTPEGEYYICEQKSNSSYYKALGLSYPNIEDAKRGYAAGLVDETQKNQIIDAINNGLKPDGGTKLGGAIQIHGENPAKLNHTAGCIEISNEAIDVLWQNCGLGCRIFIYR